MPSLFSRAFSCACSASCSTEDAPKSSSFSVASSPTSNSRFGRILGSSFNFSIMRGRKQRSGTEHIATTRHEWKPRPSEPMWSPTLIFHRPSSNAASEISSIPSLSRPHSTVSSASAASAPGLGSSPIRTQINDGDVICALKGLQASVPESPRISHRTSLPPTSLEGDDATLSRQPSCSVHGPQLYPYTFSEDDVWAEEMVAIILAAYSRSARP